MELYRFEALIDAHPRKQHDVWRLIDLCAHTEPAFFTSTVAPYLRTQAASRQEPIAQVSSLKDLRAAHDLLPTLMWKFVPAQITSINTPTHDVLEHVSELDLTQLKPTSYDDALLEAIASAPVLGRLHTLVYDAGGRNPSHELSALGLEALARSPYLQALRRLDVHKHRSEGGFEALVNSTSIRLKHLSFTMSSLTSEDMKALVDSPQMRTLESLDLGANLIDDAGALALARSPHLSRIKELHLWGNDITDEGAVPLIDALTSTIHSLALGNNSLGDASASALARSPALTNLKELDLGSNTIGDEGAIALAHARHARSIKTLSLHDNALTDRGARALLDSRSWPSLEELVTHGNRVDPDIDRQFKYTLKFAWRFIKNRIT